MSDYYCPNCGADLEDQYGFDPDKGVWTCINCGVTLYGDDVADTMEQFDGVVWYCDSCGAVLSKQSGFYDSCGTWHCTECGHANRISEDEIYESEEAYQNSKKECECPHCGSKLNDQYSFDADSDTHICTWCETTLFKDGDEYKVQYRCPYCDAVLNDQWGFNEDTYYTCDECGKSLYLSDNEYVLENDNLDDEDSDNDSSDYSGSSSYASYSSSSASSYYGEKQGQDDLRRYAEQQRKQEVARAKQEKKKDFRKKHWKGILLLIIILSAGLYSGYRYWEYTKLTPVGVNSSDVIGKKYDEVVELLRETGFTSVHSQMLNDLSFDKLSKENIVKEVSIGGDTSFSKTSKYPYDTRIVVSYHSAKMVSTPVSVKDAKGMQCAEVVSMFEKAGFGNITVEVDFDLLIGWVNKEGEVEKITINGDSKFAAEERFRTDTEVVITYHDFKKNKP